VERLNLVVKLFVLGTSFSSAFKRADLAFEPFILNSFTSMRYDLTVVEHIKYTIETFECHILG
jgi:hypothetical protein